MLTDDGATIYKTDRGIWRGNADAIERLIKGEQVAASEYYFIGLLKYSPVRLAEWKVDLSGPLSGFSGNFT